MHDAKAIELANYRLKRAKECLEEASIMLEKHKLLAVANRSYYAIFHAIRAILSLDHLDYKKHSAVIAKFRELYIKTGVFNVRFSDVIGAAFDLRGDSDYEDFFVISKEEISDQLNDSSEFILAVEEYLKNQY